MKKVAFLLVLFSSSLFATPVNINTATAQQISTSLTGIGLKKAEAIVAYREKNGPFKSASNLDAVYGIGAKTVENNKADILLASPAAPAAKPETPKSATPAKK